MGRVGNVLRRVDTDVSVESVVGVEEAVVVEGQASRIAWLRVQPAVHDLRRLFGAPPTGGLLFQVEGRMFGPDHHPLMLPAALSDLSRHMLLRSHSLMSFTLSLLIN